MPPTATAARPRIDLAVMGMMRSGTTLVADTAARATRFLVADLARGELPPRPRVELVVAFGLLEFVEDLPRLFAGLARYALPVIASYYAADDTEDLDRSTFGWRNHLTRDGLGRMVRTAGFALAAKWAAAGRQSIVRLEPASAGRPAGEAPRE
jgi:hypothetical protein